MVVNDDCIPSLKVNRQLFSSFGNIFVRVDLFNNNSELPSYINYYRRYGRKIPFSNSSKYQYYEYCFGTCFGLSVGMEYFDIGLVLVYFDMPFWVITIFYIL